LVNALAIADRTDIWLLRDGDMRLGTTAHGVIPSLPATVTREGVQLSYGSVATVPVKDLKPAESPRTQGENIEYVQHLAEVVEQLPPLLVQRHTLRVIDGMHRLRAAVSRGLATIDIQFVDCDDADMFLLAVVANVSRGLPLSLTDRRAAARRILLTHPQWSDRAIAQVVGLSHKTVGVQRNLLTGEIPQLHSRIGRDGRVRRIETAPTAPTEYEPLAGADAAASGLGRTDEAASRTGDRDGSGPGAGRSQYPEAGDRAGVVRQRQLSLEQWEMMTSRLRRDPSLRFSEAGRALLRLMDPQLPRQWARIADAVPPHCAGLVAVIALECASGWEELARRVGGSAVEVST
jgi:ParB-like chromosome segregation protein Spo0J